MSEPILLIVGLGNPGSNYSETRHNAGFWFVDELARQQHLAFRGENKFHGETCRLPSANTWLLKPSTFMNRSGQAIAALARFYRIPLTQILVVHDELDLPCGTARLKRGGGHGGHNGLRDTIQQCGGKDFLRLRIGIDHPGHKEQVSDYVLSKPSQADRQAIVQALENALAVFPLIARGELQKAMTQLHSAA